MTNAEMLLIQKRLLRLRTEAGLAQRLADATGHPSVATVLDGIEGEIASLLAKIERTFAMDRDQDREEAA